MAPDAQPFSPAYPTLDSLRALAELWNAAPAMKHFGARLEFTRVDRVRAVIDFLVEIATRDRAALLGGEPATADPGA